MVVIVLPKRITDKTVKAFDEGLKFTRGSTEETCEWEKITNIFCWSQLGVLAVIDEVEKVFLGNLVGSFKKEIEKIWQIWEERIPQKEEINRFVYPQWCRYKEMRTSAENIYWGIGVGILSSILYLWVLIDEGWNIESVGYFILIAGPLFILFCFWFGFYGLLRRFRKKYDEIHIFDDEIEVVYEDGSERSFSVRDIKKYRLKDVLFIGKIVFKDGTVLRDTERVSYFPVFRQKLLGKIEAYQDV